MRDLDSPVQEDSVGGAVPLCLPREHFNAWLAFLASSELSVPALTPPDYLVSVLLVRP